MALRFYDIHEVDSGLYVIALGLAAFQTIRIGALGARDFPAGVYLYVGRARRNLRQRVRRHMDGAGALRWHVDYLRREAEPIGALVAPGDDECALARRLASLPGAEVVPRFGSSDCRCPGHLIRLAGNKVSLFAICRISM